MILRPHSVEFLTSKSLSAVDRDTRSGLMALHNAPQSDPELTGVSVCRHQTVIHTHRAQLTNLGSPF